MPEFKIKSYSSKMHSKCILNWWYGCHSDKKKNKKATALRPCVDMFFFLLKIQTKTFIFLLFQGKSICTLRLHKEDSLNPDLFFTALHLLLGEYSKHLS